MAKHAWSWSDYEREKRRAERKALAARGREGRSTSSAGNRTADTARGCEGRAADLAGSEAGRDVPNRPAAPAKLVTSPVSDPGKARQARPVPKIDISAAPSGMEAAAARWVGKGPAPIAARPAALLCEGKVFCRCGAQRPGQERGLVPAWFGEKCIEANCELRKNRKAA